MALERVRCTVFLTCQDWLPGVPVTLDGCPDQVRITVGDGRADAAEPLARRVLDISREVAGAGSKEEAAALCALSEILHELARYRRSSYVFQRVGTCLVCAAPSWLPCWLHAADALKVSSISYSTLLKRWPLVGSVGLPADTARPRMRHQRA
jgi:hypothetical protein